MFNTETKNDSTPEIGSVHWSSGYFDWGWKGCGHGQLSFGYDRETGEWYCSTEMMGAEDVRKLLHAMADRIADELTPIIETERAEELDRRKRYEELVDKLP